MNREKIKELIKEAIDDADIDNLSIQPTGYREYEIEDFDLDIDYEWLLDQIEVVIDEEKSKEKEKSA